MPRFLFAISSAFIAFTLASCAPSERTPVAASQDAAFQKVTDDFLADYFKRNPVGATYLGIHDYDSELEDASKAAIDAEVAALGSPPSRTTA